jgi:glycosyltransferase involved in cell wall biosynthesis
MSFSVIGMGMATSPAGLERDLENSLTIFSPGAKPVSGLGSARCGVYPGGQSDYYCPMKILHVGKYYPPFRGGMETVLESLLKGLLEAEQEVSVLVAGQDDLGRREEIQHGDGAADLTRLANLGVLNSQPLTPGLPLALHREIQRFEPDLVHLHLPNPLLAATWLGLGALAGPGGLPPMAVWHHADITRQRLGRRLTAPVVGRCLGRAAGIAVSSETLLENSRDLAPWRGKVRVIPFGLDPDPWQSVESSFNGPFLFVGRLVPYKGLDILVRAMTRVPAGELVLVGEGPLAGSLSRQISELGLENRVTLAGALPRAELLRIMATSRGLVLPSLDASETFGLVQLEAMAAGLPVVASDLPTGVRQVGQEGATCLLVQPGDAAALGRALELLHRDSGLCRELGAGGRRRFLAGYTGRHMITSLLAWYDQLLGKPAKV